VFDYSKVGLRKREKSVTSKKVRRLLSTMIFIRLVLPMILVIVISFVAFAYGVWVSVYDSTLGYDLEHHILTGQSSIVLDANGDEIYRFLATQNREFISIDRLPDYVWQAFVVIEDERMFKRGPQADGIINRIGWGWDFRATLRGTYQTVVHGNSQGGSTIAQQVLRATVTGIQSGDNTVVTKAQEIILADRFMRELYSAFDGDLKAVNMHILETYINSINFGGSIHSIATASQFYFNKPAYDLTISESAVLSALLPAPNRLNPVASPEGNRVRQVLVLDYLYRDGYITEEEWVGALSDPVHERVGNFRASLDVDTVRPWFIDEVFRKLRDDLVRLGHAGTPAVASNIIHNAGLIIHTTLEPEIQSIVDEVFLDDSYWGGKDEYLVQYGLSYVGVDGEIEYVKYSNVALKTEVDIEEWRAERLEQYIGKEYVMVEEEYTEEVDRRYIIAKSGVLDGPVGISEEVRGNRDSDEIWRFPEVESIMDDSWSSMRIFNAVIEYYGEYLDVINRLESETRNRQVEVYKIPDGRVVQEDISYSINPQASTVLLENGTARVLALSGGRGEKGTNLAFNRATDSRRSSGSVAKATVYALAMDLGLFTPDSMVVDRAWKTTHKGKVWSPMNYDNRYGGSMSVRKAYARSVNTVPARYTYEDIGYERLFEFQRLVGFDLDESERVPAIAIGGYTHGVTQLEQAGFFQALANGGLWLEPIFYDSVYLKNPEDEYDSKLWFNAPQNSEQVITPKTAYFMSELSREVVLNGTGAGAKDFKYGWMGGKTGTSQDHTDLLWADYTQHFTMSAWFGYDLQRNSAGNPNSLMGRSQYQIQNAVLIQNRVYEMLGKYSEPPVEPIDSEIYFNWGSKRYLMGTAEVGELMPKRNIDRLTGRVIPPRPYKVVQRGSMEVRQVDTEYRVDSEGNFGLQPVYGEVFVPELEKVQREYQPPDVEVWDESLGMVLIVTPELELYYEYRTIYDREYYGDLVGGEWVGEPKASVELPVVNKGIEKVDIGQDMEQLEDIGVGQVGQWDDSMEEFQGVVYDILED
jgi:membrane peptidoglycan carboxypeptidase